MKHKGVRVEALAVWGIGASDQILGEKPEKLLADSLFASEGVEVVQNPKRLYRLQKLEGGQLITQFMVGDFDFVDEGIVQVRPLYRYDIMGISVKGQTELLSLYLEFLEQKVLSRAQEAGLHLPPGGLVRGR